MWEQLSVNKPHWAYLIIGGFTSLFMLVSLFVKEKLYIGEATVATICGVIFGPHAANLFNPLSWGNTDQITLECSRVVLVVQCFAVGVELPKAYMERHWRSVVFLLVPVMTFGWLITSLFIWWMITPLTWLESLAIAACVTATDPVLASSVVGKGKFAKRVPKHLRDLLSAESGCNDGMAFPFIYISFYLIHYRPDATAVAYHWFCFTILYECIWGATYGVLLGYGARHAIKWADSKGLIDRESFLVFYFVLALFCAGTGAMLGTDDLLVGFATGVGFSNDGWFTEKTEESHVSNVIDLLLNLAYFVYLGAIIPWEQYNAPELGITPWRLVVISLFVIFFRRIPIMMALKPVIPDIKTWREALFAGHFGPIGVGAIFAAILLRAELETDTTTPLAVLSDDPTTENYYIIEIVWPLVTFLVITSILVHGSSIAVFTLGKRINTLTLTMSYTQANEEGPSWMNRLPRIQSNNKGTMSRSKDELISRDSSEEKLPEYAAPGTLGPIGVPGTFLRRQKEEDTPIQPPQRARRRGSKWTSGMGPGGPIEPTAITPQRRSQLTSPEDSTSDTIAEKESPGSSREDDEPPDQLEMEVAQEKREERERQSSSKHVEEPELEAFEEGDDMIVEDEEGEVLHSHSFKGKTEEQKRQQLLEDKRELERETGGEHAKGKYHPHRKNEGDELEQGVAAAFAHPDQTSKNLWKKFGTWDGFKKKDASDNKPEPKPIEHKRGPAHAYQFGNTIIVEDEDGEVVKKYDLPSQPKQRKGARGGVQDGSSPFDSTPMREGLKRMGTWAGWGSKNPLTTEQGESSAQASGAQDGKKRKGSAVIDPDDERIRFTVGTGGRRLSKQDFIAQIASMDPKARVRAVEESDVPDAVKREVRADAVGDSGKARPAMRKRGSSSKATASGPAGGAATTQQETMLEALAEHEGAEEEEDEPIVRRVDTHQDAPAGEDGLQLVTSNSEEVPFHNVPASVQRAAHRTGSETAAERRRRVALEQHNIRNTPADADADSDDDGTERVPPSSSSIAKLKSKPNTTTTQAATESQQGETAAERRRRLAALGEGQDNESSESEDSEDDGGERRPRKGHTPVAEPGTPVGGEGGAGRRGIRFADSPAVSQGRIQWGEDVGRRVGKK
ncbi:hypothetical protein MMC21_002738 [Puttea exsequens]|nr:hypothetical protein [Puttea exsequens]